MFREIVIVFRQCTCTKTRGFRAIIIIEFSNKKMLKGKQSTIIMNITDTKDKETTESQCIFKIIVLELR